MQILAGATIMCAAEIFVLKKHTHTHTNHGDFGVFAMSATS